MPVPPPLRQFAFLRLDSWPTDSRPNSLLYALPILSVTAQIVAAVCLICAHLRKADAKFDFLCVLRVLCGESSTAVSTPSATPLPAFPPSCNQSFRQSVPEPSPPALPECP